MHSHIVADPAGAAQSDQATIPSSTTSGKWQASGKTRQCPVCGRTKDGDCRINTDGRVKCRHDKPLAIGEVVVGLDGCEYAFTGNGELGGHFKPHQAGTKRHLRAVSSGVTAKPVPAVQTLPLPDPASFFLARLSPAVAAVASRHEGEFYYYDDQHRQQRRGSGPTKELYTHHLLGGQWKAGANGTCPSWNEKCLPVLDGFPLFVEGEKTAEIACQLGLVGMSLPGHQAESLDHCTAAFKRHRQLGLTAVAYLADVGEAGKKKGEIVKTAANAAGLPAIIINAGDVWPDLPDNGSLDDLHQADDANEMIAAIDKVEILADLDQAFRDKLAEINDGNKIVNNGDENYQANNIAASSVLALDEETDEKQAALMRLVGQIVAADVAGDAVRKAALMSQTWRLGVPSVTTEGLVLEQWAQSKGIGTALATAPVEGRTIGSGATVDGIKPLLPGFINDKSLGLLIGDGGAGKSCMALSMCYSIIHGTKGFLDHQEPAVFNGKILYIGTDCGAGAYDMLKTYALEIGEAEEWKNVIFWCEEEGKRKPWTLTLYNLELLHKELAKGEIKMVIIDTINSVFQGANISPYLGPVDQWLRLLKAIVCPYGPLLMLGHTNRSGSGIKAIGGSPAFQEVPDILHTIEKPKQPADDGPDVYKWSVRKLRGESSREFSYTRVDGELAIVAGHFYTNCGDKVLAAIQAIKDTKDHPSPKALVNYTKEASNSVRSALLRLKAKGLIIKRGTCYQLTDKGESRLKAIKY